MQGVLVTATIVGAFFIWRGVRKYLIQPIACCGELNGYRSSLSLSYFCKSSSSVPRACLRESCTTWNMYAPQAE